MDRFTFKSSVDKIKAKLSGWQAKNLSITGRITLVNSVLQAMPVYPMLSVKFPLITYIEIDKVVRDFVWGSSDKGRKLHLVKWEEVCKPKGEGGLGLKKAEDMNKVFLMKLGWCYMTNPKALWVKV